MSRVTRSIHWSIALGGLWEFGDVAAFFVPDFGAVPAFLWNHIGVGLALMAVGGWAALTQRAATARRLDWAAAAAGGWLLVSAPALGGAVQPGGVWNDVIVGGLVVGLALAAQARLRRNG
jgi:hypothetical protein